MFLGEENCVLIAILCIDGRENGCVLKGGRRRKLRGLEPHGGRYTRLEQDLKLICGIGPRPLQRLDGTVI